MMGIDASVFEGVPMFRGGNIQKAIIGVMQDVGAVGKNDKNKQQGFMYRGIDAVMNALQPAMIKNGVFVVPTVLHEEREERTTKSGTVLFYTRLLIRYTFYADDGSYISADVIGEAMDSGDKATNKAMSIAFKYACFQVFCIPTEEMKDPDAEVHEVTPKSKHTENPKIAAATAKANEVKKLLVNISGDKTIPQQVWNEQYKQDAGDIAKMNEALIELHENLRRIEEMNNDA